MKLIKSITQESNIYFTKTKIRYAKGSVVEMIKTDKFFTAYSLN